jgi:hypothetical protein
VEKCVFFFYLWKVQKGNSSLDREIERPSKQIAWGEEIVFVTMTRMIFLAPRVGSRESWILYIHM